MNEWTKEREAEIERLSEEAKKAAARERILRLANKRLVDEHAETARLDAMAADHDLAIIRHNAKFHCRRRIVAEGRALSARLVEEGLRADLLNESEARVKEHDEFTAKVRAIAADYAAERARAEKAERDLASARAAANRLYQARAEVAQLAAPRAPLTEEPRIVWRGSTGDLATDIRGLLTPEQVVRLAEDLSPRAPLTEDEARGRAMLACAEIATRHGFRYSSADVDSVVAASRGDIPAEVRPFVCQYHPDDCMPSKRLCPEHRVGGPLAHEVTPAQPDRAAEIASLRADLSQARGRIEHLESELGHALSRRDRLL